MGDVKYFGFWIVMDGCVNDCLMSDLVYILVINTLVGTEEVVHGVWYSYCDNPCVFIDA